MAGRFGFFAAVLTGSVKTASFGVRNRLYCEVRERNLTCASVWPWFGSNDNGRFPKLAAMRVCSACTIGRRRAGELVAGIDLGWACRNFPGHPKTRLPPTKAIADNPAIQRVLVEKPAAFFNNMFLLRKTRERAIGWPVSVKIPRKPANSLPLR